jgi:hypothetical protein
VHRHFLYLPFSILAISSSYNFIYIKFHLLYLPFLLLATSSICHFLYLPFPLLTIAPIWHILTCYLLFLPFHHLTSVCHFFFLPLPLLATFSPYHLLSLPFFLLALSSISHFLELQFHQTLKILVFSHLQKHPIHKLPHFKFPETNYHSSVPFLLVGAMTS